MGDHDQDGLASCPLSGRGNRRTVSLFLLVQMVERIQAREGWTGPIANRLVTCWKHLTGEGERERAKQASWAARGGKPSGQPPGLRNANSAACCFRVSSVHRSVLQVIPMSSSQPLACRGHQGSRFGKVIVLIPRARTRSSVSSDSFWAEERSALHVQLLPFSSGVLFWRRFPTACQVSVARMLPRDEMG